MKDLRSFQTLCPSTYWRHPFKGCFLKAPVRWLHAPSLFHLPGTNFTLTCFTRFYFTNSSQYPWKRVLLGSSFYS